MEEKNYTDIVPVNLEGGIINAESTSEQPDLKSAAALYQTAKKRLLDVNNWHKLAGEEMANFQLANESGQEISGNVKEGFFLKVNVPGPGTEAGDGYDWVRVEEIKEYKSGDIESIGIRVRPSSNPTTNNNETAHFYSSESTSTFTVTRENTKITAAIYDRNTKANPDSGNLLDQIRNSIVGVTGRFVFSKIQWKKLAEGLISL